MKDSATVVWTSWCFCLHQSHVTSPRFLPALSVVAMAFMPMLSNLEPAFSSSRAPNFRKQQPRVTRRAKERWRAGGGASPLQRRQMWAWPPSSSSSSLVLDLGRAAAVQRREPVFGGTRGVQPGTDLGRSPAPHTLSAWLSSNLDSELRQLELCKWCEINKLIKTVCT